MITVDWQAFTPWSALTGGVLIGLAAAGLVLLNGRIAGISGILGGVLTGPRSDRTWRIAFLVGMLVAPLISWALFSLPAIEINAGIPMIIVAGLLVGLGTRYGSGCTSGHGVCGLSRVSPRSLVATIAFMTAGFVTVYLLRHVLGG
ncbi:YeeE/YedE family protein [Marinobacter changyiensis]|uniref:YeeE/YedE family protein n=1 Tax=Marinobacter changyiensis TaxID=2604091 RepID=UPI00126501DE|nr:YeeE/YedE family protein [Marinobacter changyiensis]